jgi:uncharacterized membrane protein YhaH (DUF805 family)
MEQQDLGPFAPLTMPVRQLLFSFRGRIPRSTWWAAWGISLFVCCLLLLVVNNAGSASAEFQIPIDVLMVGVMSLVLWVNLNSGLQQIWP